MRKVIFYFLLLVLAGELISLLVINRKKDSQKVLAEETVITPSPTATVTPSPTPLPTPTPMSTSKPTPTGTPTPTPVPKPKYTSEEINGFIERFAAQYNVDPNLLRHIAICESGFNPSAYHAGYAGLYQFGPTTWKNIRSMFGEDPDPALRYNAEEATQTAAYALHINVAGIWPNCVH